MKSTLRALSTLGLLTSLAVAIPSFAMTYRPMRDGELADHAPLIVQAEFLSRELSPAGGSPATDYLIRVEQLLKGSISGTHLLLRLPGGIAPDGEYFKVFGVPHFEVGERALLFLTPRSDGTYDSHGMSLGTFRRFERDGVAYALRDLSEGHAVDAEGKKLEVRPEVRDFERFASWLEDRGRGIGRGEDYRVALPESRFQSLIEEFTLFRTSNGLNFRWFVFDAGGRVTWRSQPGGQPSLTGGGLGEFRNALGHWNRVSRTNIDLQYVGTSGLRGGLDNADGVNVILFDDPENQVSGNCFTTGILAAANARGIADSTFQGRLWVRITEGDIVTNNGGALCRFNNPDYFEQVITHEVGHTLGIGHSCGDTSSPSCGNPVLDDAVMRASAHNDGRDGTLRTDDIAAARALYRSVDGGGGGGGGPRAPSGVEVALDKLDVLVSWQDESTDESAFRIYRGPGGGQLTQIAELTADTTSFRDQGLDPETTYDYVVASVRGGQEGRSSRVSVTTPPRLPVTIELELASAAVAGQVVSFRATVTGPAQRVEWDFGEPGHRGFSTAPCAADVFCKSHIFTVPFSVDVTATVVGDLDQTATAIIAVPVTGPAAPFTTAESFLQSAIFGPRGNTGTFQSNLWMLNAGDSATLVELSYLPRGITGVEPDKRFLTLEPGTSTFLENVLSRLFGTSSTSGAIGLRYLNPQGAGAPDVRTISRSFVELGSRDAGSFGQFVGENPAASHSTADKVVTGILEGDAFVSTLLAANVGDVGGPVRVELFDAAGAKVGETASFSLGQRSMRFQRTRVLFPGVLDRVGPFTARFFTEGSNSFVASATLLEARSEDQIFVPAEDLTLLDSNPVHLPRVTRGEGQFGVSLASQLVAYNPAATATELTLELLLRGQANTDPQTAALTLPPGEVFLVEDLILELFGLEVATGAVTVSWQNSDGVAPKLLSYAFASSIVDGVTQRFGMLVNSRGGGEGATTATLDLGAEQSDLFKASFGAINLTAAGATLELTLKDGEGRILGSKERALRSRQHLELNLEGLFNDAPIGEGGNWFVEARVVRGGPVLTYLANINVSGDIFFVPGRSAD